MRDTINPIFRRPIHTHRVKGQRSVGMDSSQIYWSECEYADKIGSGSGLTPAAARSAARLDLVKQLSAVSQWSK